MRPRADVRSSQSLYRLALTDWLACAVAGARLPMPLAALRDADGVAGIAAALGIAGHVLDYDDTYSPGLCHISAAVAPAVLSTAASVDASMDVVLSSFEVGFEAMASLARASHPSLYEGSWHPTAVAGVWGASRGAAAVLGLDDEATSSAVRLALLGAGGLQSAFGTDGKSVQVGMAAAQGVTAAMLAASGAMIDDRVVGSPTAGFEAVYGATVPTQSAAAAIGDNWIKAYPCCLQTHSAIEAAAEARRRGVSAGAAVAVAVHPISVMAASVRRPRTPLEAKFSLPYLVAHTLDRGAPSMRAFDRVEPAVLELADAVELVEDAALDQSEARVTILGDTVAVTDPLGSPGNPMNTRAHQRKLDELDAVEVPRLVDEDTPARELLKRLGLAV